MKRDPALPALPLGRLGGELEHLGAIEQVGKVQGRQRVDLVVRRQREEATHVPEVAILGVSRSTMKPVWNGSEFVPRLVLPLSLSYDHRVVDGAMACRFVVHLSNLLSDVRRLLL